jgi:hypothetical protein
MIHSVPFPSKLYKYMRKADAEKMVSYGSIRIGTLYEYRRNYENSSLNDQDEGVLEFTDTRPFISLETGYQNDPENGIVSQLFDFKTCENVKLVNLNVKIEAHAQDSHIFCVSLEKSESLLKKFIDDGLDYDACVEISSFYDFSKCVHENVFSDMYDDFNVIAVDYSGNYKNNVTPQVIKIGIA